MVLGPRKGRVVALALVPVVRVVGDAHKLGAHGRPGGGQATHPGLDDAGQVRLAPVRRAAGQGDDHVKGFARQAGRVPCKGAGNQGFQVGGRLGDVDGNPQQDPWAGSGGGGRAKRGCHVAALSGACPTTLHGRGCSILDSPAAACSDQQRQPCPCGRALRCLRGRLISMVLA